MSDRRPIEPVCAVCGAAHPPPRRPGPFTFPICADCELELAAAPPAGCGEDGCEDGYGPDGPCRRCGGLGGDFDDGDLADGAVELDPRDRALLLVLAIDQLLACPGGGDDCDGDGGRDLDGDGWRPPF